MPAPRFGKHCYFSEGAVIVGDVEMGDDCTVWFNAVVRGDVHYIRIGNRTNIQDNSCLHTLNGKAPVILGDDVTIGHSVTLHGCQVQDGALVGMGATVLDHAVVGRGAIVAAGALVLSNTQMRGRAVGRSPRQICQESGPRTGTGTESDLCAPLHRIQRLVPHGRPESCQYADSNHQ